MSLTGRCALVTLCVAVAATGSAQADPSLSQRSRDLATAALAAIERAETVPESEQPAIYRKGLELAERAVELDDGNADAHYAVFAHRGQLMRRDGFLPNPFGLWKLNRSLERALELDPDHADALAARGAMYRQLPALLGGSPTKAEADLRRAIALDPTMVGARLELAETLAALGKPQAARAVAEEALERATAKGDSRLIAAAEETARRLGAGDRAEDSWRDVRRASDSSEN